MTETRKTRTTPRKAAPSAPRQSEAHDTAIIPLEELKAENSPRVAHPALAAGKVEKIERDLEEALHRTVLAVTDARVALDKAEHSEDRIDALSAGAESLSRRLAGLEKEHQELADAIDAGLEERDGELGRRLTELDIACEEKIRLGVQPALDQVEELKKLYGSALALGMFSLDASARGDFIVPAQGPLDTFALDDILRVMIAHNSTSLHLKAGSHPTVRIAGELIPVGDQTLTDEDCRRLIVPLMSRAQRVKLAEGKEVELSRELDGMRFRVNVFLQRGTVSAAFQMVRTAESCAAGVDLPAALLELCTPEGGLLLVTGPPRVGKSRVLAALIHSLNRSRKAHIITIEDPITVLHEDGLSIVTQREVGVDTLCIHEGLLQAARQDPDVIMLSRMDEPETIVEALKAAERGCLVLAAMVSRDLPSALSRLVYSFPQERTGELLLLLAANLKAVIVQKPVEAARRRAAAPGELVVISPEEAQLLLEGRFDEIGASLSEAEEPSQESFGRQLIPRATEIPEDEPLHPSTGAPAEEYEAAIEAQRRMLARIKAAAASQAPPVDPQSFIRPPKREKPATRGF